MSNDFRAAEAAGAFLSMEDLGLSPDFLIPGLSGAVPSIDFLAGEEPLSMDFLRE